VSDPDSDYGRIKDRHPISTKEFSIGQMIDEDDDEDDDERLAAADCFAPAPIAVSLRKGASRSG